MPIEERCPGSTIAAEMVVAHARATHRSGFAYTQVPVVSIVPSQIVEYVDASIDKTWFQRNEFDLGADGAVGIVAGLLDLVDRVPAHLVTLEREDAARLFASLAAIRASVQRAQTIGLQERQLTGVPRLKPIRPGAENPIMVVCSLFGKCADEAPHPKTPDLPFLDDQELKISLRSDLDQAYRALENEQWKSATVMSGVVLESLLLWKLRQPWSSVVTQSAADRKLSQPPERWDLADYIAVASNAKLITEEIGKQCELCKDFRNLIHPGREIRLQQRATRGRALGALAAVELVIEFLSR